MKRISRSLLSLCLAFVLCAALLPNTNVAKAANEGPFMITGYDVSSSSVAMGDEVTVTLYLYRTDGKNDSISLIRSVDSFQGDSTYYPQAPSAGKDGTTYTVNLNHLTYTGDDARTLKFTIYYTNKNGEGAYQDGSVIIRECVPYTEPKPEPEPTPETIPEPRAVFSSDGMSTAIAAGQTKTITVYIQNAGTTAMRDPILTLKSSGSLLIMAVRTTCSTISARAATRLSP